MLKDSMDGGSRFSIHHFFISIFNEFYLTPSQITPNGQRKALYFLYIYFSEKTAFSIDFFWYVLEIYVLSQYNAFV